MARKRRTRKASKAAEKQEAHQSTGGPSVTMSKMLENGKHGDKTHDMALSWRMDSRQSLSDWSIDVVYLCKNSDQTTREKMDTYHVHKCYLGAGPRKGGYFAKVIESDGTQSNESDNGHKSQFECHELVAQAFPVMLDYVYSADGSLDITTENATALSFLAMHLDMPHLQRAADVFWREDGRSAYTCGTHYEHACLLQYERRFQAAAAICADKIWSIPTTSRLLHVPDTTFWLKLVARGPKSMQSVAGDDHLGDGDKDNGDMARLYDFVGHEFSRRMSKLIVEFFRNSGCVDKAAFRTLTDEGSLPIIDGEVAIWMLELERRICAPDDTTLTPLQERCINAFALDWTWSRMDLLQTVHPSKLLGKQSPLVVTELMFRTLSVVSERSVRAITGFDK